MRSWLICFALCAIGCRQLLGIEPAVAGDASDPDSPSDASVTSPRRLVFGGVSGADVANVPILVALDSTTIDYAAVANPATDLRFHDDGTAADLPFEIERWDPAGQSFVWVLVPLVPAIAPTSILMFFGANAGGSEMPTAVWSGNDAVHHFGPQLKSSTGTHDGTSFGTSQAAGQIASAAEFTGTGDQRITFANGAALFDGWSAFTLELWVYPDYASAADVPGEPRVMDKGGSLTLGRLFVSGSDIHFTVDLHFTGANDAFVNTAVVPRTWTYLAYVFDGNNKLQLFKDGVQVAQGNLTGTSNTLLVSSQDFFLGNQTTPFVGMIDELRIAQTARSPDFLRVQNLSMTRQLVTFQAP